VLNSNTIVCGTFWPFKIVVNGVIYMVDMSVCDDETISPSHLSTASEDADFMPNLLVLKDQWRGCVCGINPLLSVASVGRGAIYCRVD
jgi:hypothetical protein